MAGNNPFAPSTELGPEQLSAGVGFQKAKAGKDPKALRLGWWVCFTWCTGEPSSWGKIIENLPRGRVLLKLRSGTTLIIPRSLIISKPRGVA